MAITYTTYASSSPNNANTSVTTGTMTVLAQDIIIVCALFTDSNAAGTLTCSNSGTAITWNPIANVNVAGRCRVAAWWGLSTTTENRTATVAWNSGNNLNWGLFSMVHSGAHQTNPVPTGNVFSGSAASSVTQAITPTASGSALWLIGANADDVNASTFTAGANCTIDRTAVTDTWDAALIRPTTQPRTDSAAFTLSETHTGSFVSWVAFEVQAAGAAQSQAPRSMHMSRMRLGF